MMLSNENERLRRRKTCRERTSEPITTDEAWSSLFERSRRNRRFSDCSATGRQTQPVQDRLVVMITWEEALLLVIGFKSPRVCQRVGRLPFFHDGKSTVLASKTCLPIR